MKPEKWADVYGYKGLYRVSTYGRMKRVGGYCNKYTGGKILKHEIGKDGYPAIGLWLNGNRSRQLIHRLVLMAFVGPCPPGMECCHYDGNRKNFKLENLRWDTRSSNMLDSVRHGTHFQPDNHGSRQGRAKLVEVDVVKILHLLSKGHLTQKEIGKHFNVSKETISDIHNKRTWKHVL